MGSVICSAAARGPVGLPSRRCKGQGCNGAYGVADEPVQRHHMPISTRHTYPGRSPRGARTAAGSKAARSSTMSLRCRPNPSVLQCPDAVQRDGRAASSPTSGTGTSKPARRAIVAGADPRSETPGPAPRTYAMWVTHTATNKAANMAGHLRTLPRDEATCPYRVGHPDDDLPRPRVGHHERQEPHCCADACPQQHPPPAARAGPHGPVCWTSKTIRTPVRRAFGPQSPYPHHDQCQQRQHHGQFAHPGKPRVFVGQCLGVIQRRNSACRVAGVMSLRPAFKASPSPVNSLR